MNAQDSTLSKQEIWGKIANAVDRCTDKIGCPIDTEIKEIVIALNAIGIKTTASCEGHLEDRCVYPWVDLVNFSPEIYSQIENLTPTLKLIEIEKTSLEKKYPKLSIQDCLDLPDGQRLLELYEERDILSESIDQAEMQCLEPASELLNEFYEKHNFSYDRMLILSGNRLQNVGAHMQIIRSEEEQKLKLMEYQAEMNAFATFLKNKFMNSN